VPKTLRTVEMTSPPDDVDTVHDLLSTVWQARDDISLLDRIAFETAVVELVGNVMRHAHEGDGVRCQLDVVVQETTLEATLTDSGEPGNITIRGRALPDEMAESGRGIPLITALVDVVDYSREEGVNRWYVSRGRTS
jgi:serine/threonine-protein kinase RsbW